MKRFIFTYLAKTIIFLFAVLFFSGENLAESALINQEIQQTVIVPWLSLLLADTTVSDIINTVDTNDYVTNTEVVTDESGRKIALTKMLIVFKPSATPIQLKQLLASLNGTITSSVARTRSIVVRIPHPGTLEAYFSLINQVEAESFVDFVWMGEIPKLAALPSNFYSDPPNSNELPYIDNHLAIRAFAAWNAAEAIDENYEPQVVIADSFGEGKPYNNSINYSLPVDEFATKLWDGGHGYAVLGIIAGTHGQYYTTGIYPKKISLKVVDHPDSGNSNRLIFAEIMNKLLITLTRTPGKVVVNTSIGYACDGTGGNCIDINEAREIASLWVEYVRLYGLEGRVLHVTSAGNIDAIPGFPGLVIRDARTNSPFASAARLGGLSDGFDQPMANLSNTVVIENAINTPVEIQPIKTKCLHKDSFVGGNLAGIGTNVRSFDMASGIESDQIPGTSFATPQVAGLAAYIWGIDHTLTPQQIKNLLISTSDSMPVVSSDPECSNWTAPAPIVDAYEALLALDYEDMSSISNVPVRFAILDVNEDNSFNEADLQLFVNKYSDTSGGGLILIDPDVPDYSRYDLNGDGWTGGSKSTAFDLDIDRVFEQQVTQSIGGENVEFDESAVSDGGILCYYAYSNLYTGDTDIRDDLIGSQCGMDDCIYKVATYNPEAPLYFKYCRRSNVPGIFQLTHSSNSGFHTIRVEQEVCNEPQYNLDDECPGDNYNSRITMIWSEWYPGSTISLEIDYLNNLQVSTDYYCSAEGELTKSPSDPGTDGIIGQYDTLDACYTVLKTYIPINPSAFDYPGDCHDWWDHAGETCVY